MTAPLQTPASSAAPRPTASDLSWRTHNMGRVLFSASHVFVLDELRVVNENAPFKLTQAQMALFQNLDSQTTGLTQIAARAMMTKQAMLELVDKAERLGLVYRRPDPDDRRAKHVELTAAGAEVVERLTEAEAAAEARLASIVGSAFVDKLRSRLRRYIDGIRADVAASSASSPGAETCEWPDHLGRVLRAATDVFVGEGMRVVREAGLEGVRDVDMALYRNPDLSGTRLTVVAERAQMTKQAMRELVAKTITQAGFRADTENDGESGWHAFRRVAYDLVITGNEMPGLTGTMLIQRIRGFSKEPPCMLISGNQFEAESTLVPLIGQDGFLAKPISPAALIEKVYHLLLHGQSMEP